MGLENRDSLAQEFEMELQKTVNNMKGALDLELHASCQELAMLLNTWQNGLVRVAESWAQHLEDRQFDASASPAMARQVADGLAEAALMLSEQLARRRSDGGAQLRKIRGPVGQVMEAPHGSPRRSLSRRGTSAA